MHYIFLYQFLQKCQMAKNGVTAVLRWAHDMALNIRDVNCTCMLPTICDIFLYITRFHEHSFFIIVA